MSLIGEYGYPVLDSRGGMKRLVDDAGAFQDAMELLQLRLGQDFLNVWGSIPDGWSDERKFKYLVQNLSDLQLVYGDSATTLAAEFLNLLRDGADLPMVLAEPANREQIKASVGWAMSKPETQQLLWGSMQRMAMQSYRETIQLSAWEAGNGFARVPEPKACSFCLMLASRGAVYYSKEAALSVGGGKYGKRSSTKRRTGEPYHDHCRCDVIEVSERSGLTEANVYLNDLWQQTFYEGKTATESMRKKRKTKWASSREQRELWDKALADADLPWLSSQQLVKPE